MLIEIAAGAIGAIVAAVGIHLAAPDRAPERVATGPSERPEQLERLERALELASTAGDLHVRLRPVLRDVAVARLWSRGVDLDERADAAQDLLGDSLWEVVRKDRPPPGDAFARGATAEQLDAMLDRLEAL